MPKIRQVLYLQQPEIIERQRAEVEQVINSQLGVPVSFASSVSEVVPGADYDVVISPTLPWLSEVLARLPHLQWVHFLSAGVEKIWRQEYDWSSIYLSKSSGIHSVPMSEFAIGAMLYFAKGFDRFVEQARNHVWQRFWLEELTGKTLVVLGMGSVGTEVAERSISLGMNVVGIANRRRPGTDLLVDTPDSLSKHLEEADYVVVTVPLTSQTSNMIDAKFFETIKSGAVLVDISRGGVINTESLLTALDTGKLRGAALDVFEVEPLPESSPLWKLSNVLLTPHVAGTTPHYLERALEIFTSNAAAYQSNKPLPTAVDPSLGY